ncbi:hypothetical protein HOY82DRAFT_374592 [Tuber indicum]|nr:hypothetical protein HOY82DRAFT_374592 [Tuber indicum]
MSRASQQDNSKRPASPLPKTRPTHGVRIGNNNRNSGNIDSSYNTINYIGNTKNFGQGGAVIFNGATVH